MSSDEFKFGLKLICNSFEAAKKGRDRENETSIKQLNQKDALINELYDKIHRLETQNNSMVSQVEKNKSIIGDLQYQVKELTEMKKTLFNSFNKEMSIRSNNSEYSSDNQEIKENLSKSLQKSKDGEIATLIKNLNTRFKEPREEKTRSEGNSFELVHSMEYTDTFEFFLKIKTMIPKEDYAQIVSALEDLQSGKKSKSEAGQCILAHLAVNETLRESFKDIFSKEG